MVPSSFAPRRDGPRRLRALAAALAMLLLVACVAEDDRVVDQASLDGRPSQQGQESVGGSDPGRSPAENGWTVPNVVDGDTLDVIGPDGARERVRLVGVDTPERGECGFERATERVRALVRDEPVELAGGAPDDRDRYDRLLRYVEAGDTDVGLALIRDGLAVARYDSRDGYGAHPREEAYVAADATSDHVCADGGADGDRGSESDARDGGPESAWADCDAARAADAAPVLRGEPGYGPHLDGDDDGVGCE